jgi:drug/metabolite transporter (DMT)-like permease
MFSTFWSSPVALAIVAALCYGIGSPIMKIGMEHGGVSSNAMLFAYGIGALVVSFIWWKVGDGPIEIGTNAVGVMSMIAVGLLLGIAFVGVTRAFALPTGSVTMVMTLVAAYPVLSSAIEIVFMDAKVRPVQALAGCVLVIVGGILVATSTTSGE